MNHQLKTFEALSVDQGFVFYETSLPPVVADPIMLRATIRDRALVYVDNQLRGTLSRMDKISAVPLERPYGQHLGLLVENQGRLNFGNEIRDFKVPRRANALLYAFMRGANNVASIGTDRVASQGVSNVTISGVPLINWNMTAYAFSNVSSLRDTETIIVESGFLIDGPVFLRGRFTISDQALDTYLDTTGWGKGVAFVNGHNLGRYWPILGPQITLYVPAPYLRTGMNELILLELEYVSQTRKMKFQSVPNLGQEK